MNVTVTFTYLIVGYGILLYMAVEISRPDKRKRILSELSKWNPWILYVGLVNLFVGISTLVSNVPLQRADPLVSWGFAILGVILVVMGLWLSIKMISNWLSKRDSDSSAN